MQFVLLSGGSGKRLWPLSNDLYSKQFIKILKAKNGDRISMLQRVYEQIREAIPNASITVATAASQAKLIKKQLSEDISISLEPCRRDTFPAIALVCAYLRDVKGVPLEEAVVICPADPYVEVDYFKSVKKLAELAEKRTHDIMLMGIEPTYPSSKYGYIIPEAKESISKVSSFREKPSVEEASHYIAKGALWNGGVFAFRLGYVLTRAREIIGFNTYEELWAKYDDVESISFDYAILEKTDNIGVLRYNGEWRDIGTWNTFTEVMNTNSLGKVALDDSSINTHAISTLDIPILGMGLNNIVVAASPEGIFIADKESSAQMKPYVEKLHTPIRYTEKSWGEFHIIDIGAKSLTIKVTLMAGHSLTYHKHEHRDEVWTIIEGEGVATLEGKERIVKIGDTINIPRYTLHSIRATTNLQIMEVQTGDISIKDKLVEYN